VLLVTREITFKLGWLQIQLILFCQLAGITNNRPEALVQLQYRHLKLTLIRDYNNPRPQLFSYSKISCHSTRYVHIGLDIEPLLIMILDVNVAQADCVILVLSVDALARMKSLKEIFGATKQLIIVINKM